MGVRFISLREDDTVVAIARNAERAAVAEESDSALADVPEGETADVFEPPVAETGVIDGEGTNGEGTDGDGTGADDLAGPPGEEGTAE